MKWYCNDDFISLFVLFMRYLSFVILAVVPVLFMSFSKWQSDGPQACTKEYAPVCASVQVQCVTTPCDPVEETFGNRCMMEANKQATFLHAWECEDMTPPSDEEMTICTMEYAPVCGVDGITYGNACSAGKNPIAYQGECALPDLAYCTSYFDGCNTCSVEQWQVSACTEMACESYAQPRCTAFAENVIVNQTVLLDAGKKEHVSNVFNTVTAQRNNLEVASQQKYYTLLSMALDLKVKEWKDFAMVASFTPEGYAMFQRKIVLFAYLHFLTQEKLQDLMK